MAAMTLARASVVVTTAATMAVIGCLVAAAVIGAGTSSRSAELMSRHVRLTYDGLYQLHRVPRKRLVRGLGDPVPAFVPSKPSRSSLAMTAARDRNRVDMIEDQLRTAKQEMLAAHVAAEHRGLMAQSRHGSSRLFRLLSHQKQDEKKALAMASADFKAPPHASGRWRSALQTGANAGAMEAGHLSEVSSEGAQQNAAVREVHHSHSGMGALDLVPEKDENVLGSLGGEEDLDGLNRDGALSSNSDDRNTFGSLFAVRAPEEATAESRPKSAVSLRYRPGHWTRDGLLWVVGDGERRPYHAQKDLKLGLANVAHGSDVEKSVRGARSGGGADGDARVAALKSRVALMQQELQRMEGGASPDARVKADAGAQPAATGPMHPAPSTEAPNGKRAPKADTTRARRRDAAAAAASHRGSALSTGPLSLKRLLKDFGKYEAAFASFFSDDAHPKARTRFARAKSAWAKPPRHHTRRGNYWVDGTVS